MEQQLIEMLEILKQGLAEIPAIGSDLYDVYISGIRFEGGVTLAVFGTIIIVLVSILLYLNHLANRVSRNDDIPITAMVFVIMALFAVIVVALFSIHGALMKVFAPDYMLIERVVSLF